MSIRTILVTLEGSEGGASALQTALQAAQIFGADLEVLQVCADPAELFPFMTEPASSGSIELVLESAERGTAEIPVLMAH